MLTIERNSRGSSSITGFVTKSKGGESGGGADGERAMMVDERAMMVDERPMMVGERQTMVGERPMMVGERPTMV